MLLKFTTIQGFKKCKPQRLAHLIATDRGVALYHKKEGGGAAAAAGTCTQDVVGVFCVVVVVEHPEQSV